MLGAWRLAASLIAIFGVPLIAVAVIVWLCERRWGKRYGELGSFWADASSSPHERST